jgi:hypothetical protein
MRIAIRAEKLIDGKGGRPQENVLTQVEGDKIISISGRRDCPLVSRVEQVEVLLSGDSEVSL